MSRRSGSAFRSTAVIASRHRRDGDGGDNDKTNSVKGILYDREHMIRTPSDKNASLQRLDSDSKISTHARMLSRSETIEAFIKTCSQIESLLESPENQKYMMKSFQFFENQLLDAFKWIQSATWKESGMKVYGSLLANISNAMEGHSSSFFSWLIDSVYDAALSTNKSSLAFVIRDVLLHAINSMKPRQVATLISKIQENFENISEPHVFKIFSSLFAAGILANQNIMDSTIFQDFSDIVIGWMTDGYDNELGDIDDHCYAIIQSLGHFFAKEVEFLTDFIISIVDFVKDAAREKSLNCVRILRLLKTLECLLALRIPLDKSFLGETMTKILREMNGILVNEDCRKSSRKSRSFVQLTNQCLSLCPGIDCQETQNFIKVQLTLFQSNSKENENGFWNLEIIIGFLDAIYTWTETVGAHSQLTDSTLEVCKEIMTFLDRTIECFTPYEQTRSLRVVHSLLRTRNLNLLQSVYAWVLGKLKMENTDVDDMTKRVEIKADIDTQLFVLACLTNISTNKSGSILILWALDPPIIDLLMSIARNSTASIVRKTALELLKSHAIAHSHFTSGITSRDDDDSPTSKFLKSLLDFWTEEVQKKTQDLISWLFDWISLYLQTKTTVFYTQMLLEHHFKFYEIVLTEFANHIELRKSLGDLLCFMVQEPNYMQARWLEENIREICLNVLLSEKVEFSVQESYSKALKALPNRIVLPYELNLTNTDDWKEENEDDSDKVSPLISNTDLNDFLQNLLVYGKPEKATTDILTVPSELVIKASVDYLIRSKLKTTLGRAQEFFSQLQHMVRKIVRKGVSKHLQWKLEFIYQLQRKILLCIYESAFLPTDIPENIRSFYITNKVPCTGWLKRIGPECIEASLSMKSYAMAYFFSVSIQDDKKAKLALLELQDAEALKGMGELGGYFYLNSEYEKAEHMANLAKSEGADIFSDTILERTKLIFENSISKLENWNVPQPLTLEPLPDLLNIPLKQIPVSHPWRSDLLKLPVESVKTPLSIQLEHFGISGNVEIIGGTEAFSKLKLYEMVQVEDFILNSNKHTFEEKRRTQASKLEKMIACGNLQHSKTWITRSGWLDMCKLDFSLEQKANTFKILGDLLYKEGNFFEAGTLYSSVLELMEEEANNISLDHTFLIPNEFKANFYVSFARKVKNSEPFYERAASKSALLEALEGRHETQQLFHDRARESSRNCTTQIRADAWFDYATFAYERSEEESVTQMLKDILKSNALHSYANFVKWNQKKKKNRDDRRGNIITAMILLLKLYHQNHKFIPEDLITSELWLNVLPELVKIPELRSFILAKFPEEATFLIASLEFTKDYKVFAQRRGIFDSTSFSYTEASEDPYTVNSHEKDLCPLEDGRSSKNIQDLHWQNKNSVIATGLEISQKMGNFITIVREIDRIGLTNEELWAGVIQRMSSDWIKRMNTLRKDLARDRGGNPDKVKAYIFPVLTFLKELWRITAEGDTPSDVAFICKFHDKIKTIIDDLEKCTTVEKFMELYDCILHFSNVLELSRTSKLSLSIVSPVLVQYNFSDPGYAVNLPGLPRGVTIHSVNSVISCLPTKTNPKRISFRGSDGKIYEYLIKGNENLHIDAGIMQLLKVIQEFTGCHTRHYSVTPIGERGGLIQIVRNALPLFVLYKKYLQRNSLILRPSEIFWRRMQRFGFKDRTDIEGVKEVYNSLKDETPSDLISRDLLLCAENTMDWYQAVKTFTRDCAMGAGMGHVLGLADRHLDNILINLRQGDLVHVDFSILFGKGEHLKVPERVPFRLTQNIVHALQYPGIKGAFFVHLDKFLESFHQKKDLVTFCVDKIAASSLLEESVHVSPEVILKSEIKATLELIRLRVRNIWKIMELLLGEFRDSLLEQNRGPTTTAWLGLGTTQKLTIDRLKRKIFRWRRLLANIDPLVNFVVKHTTAAPPLSGFHRLILANWTPHVIHFWSHVEIETVIQSSAYFEDKFKICENILQQLLHEIPSTIEDCDIKIPPGLIVSSGQQTMDDGKVQSIMNAVDTRLSVFIPSETATRLIEEATNEDNLSQMFEGWIAWV